MKVNFTKEAVLSRLLTIQNMFLETEALINATFNCSSKDFARYLKVRKLDIYTVENMETLSDDHTIMLAYLIMIQKIRNSLASLEELDCISQNFSQKSGEMDS